MQFKNRSRGFTLIELIVVMAMIGVLAISSNIIYTNSQMKSRNAVRQVHLVGMKSAIEQLYTVTGQYPKPSKIKASLLDFNLSALPSDPRSGDKDKNTRYEYVYASSFDDISRLPGQNYEVSADLEYGKDHALNSAEKTDRGNDEVRWEVGKKTSIVNTDLPAIGNECANKNEYAAGDEESGNCTIIDDL